MAFVSIVTTVLASGVDERAIALQLEKQQANPEASYVLHEFPDADHHAAIILSQGDTAKVCFALCFDAAVLGDSDPRLIATMPNQVRIRRAACVRRMYLLLVAGARTGPGEIQHETSRRFPGDAGFQERLREQLCGSLPILINHFNHSVIKTRVHVLETIKVNGAFVRQMKEDVTRFLGS